MKFILNLVLTILAIASAFVLCGGSTFFGLLYWDSYVMHDHDGQAGIGFLIVAFWVGVACAAVTGFFVARHFWIQYSSSDPE